jgi:hypothetical protein
VSSISQQECRFVELQAERLVRRAEGKKRRATETKIKEDAILKRRIAEGQKTTRQKGSASSRAAIPLRRIEEGEISDDDDDTQECLSKGNDLENVCCSLDTTLRGLPSVAVPSDETASSADDVLTGKQSITSAIVALKLRDLAVRSDSLAINDIFMDSRSPPPKPPKPVKPPRHSDQPTTVAVTAFGSSSGLQLPASIRDVIGNDSSLIAMQPQPPPLPPLGPKAIETELELESQAVPRAISLRPKSVKFSMSFLDLSEESYQQMPSVTQSSNRHILAEVDPLDSSLQDPFAPSQGRPTSRRLRPTSVDTRRQRSGLTVNPQDIPRSGTTNKCAPHLLPQTLSCSDHSSSLAPVRGSGLSILNRVHEISTNDEGANGPRISMDVPGGSAVSAILARRKHLEDDSDVSDSDKDSDSDWE